jgi:hypothetical protein
MELVSTLGLLEIWTMGPVDSGATETGLESSTSLGWASFEPKSVVADLDLVSTRAGLEAKNTTAGQEVKSTRDSLGTWVLSSSLETWVYGDGVVLGYTMTSLDLGLMEYGV